MWIQVKRIQMGEPWNEREPLQENLWDGHLPNNEWEAEEGDTQEHNVERNDQ